MDFDGDGIRDLISGSYDPGALYLFRGKGQGEFAAGEMILDKSGKPVLRVPDQKVEWESFGSWVTMVDWDADVDLDLVVGGFGGEVFVRLNEGTRQAPAFATSNMAVKLNDEDLKVPGDHATPVIADWDGDGQWDLLSGSATGAVHWYRNVGQEGAPAFADPVTLVPEHTGHGYGEFVDTGEEPAPGIRSQIFVTDHNGDGKLDLLLGDFSTTVSPRTDLSADERQAMLDIRTKLQELDAELAVAREKFTTLLQEFMKQFPEETITSDEIQEKIREKQKELQEEEWFRSALQPWQRLNTDLQQYLAKPAPSDWVRDMATPHGYVWLFLRTTTDKGDQ
ncbi:MAG: FG-GAP repeat domain-containing protein [Pirellulaceae bacterium]